MKCEVKGDAGVEHFEEVLRNTTVILCFLTCKAWQSPCNRFSKLAR